MADRQGTNGVWTVHSSSTTGGELFNGTSAATPQVAGAAAILREMHPTLSPALIEALLLTYATAHVIQDPRGSTNRMLFVNF